ncbi:glycoside hydrolase family 32 protein [Streptomyces sp. PSKA54]|uniref:beta-fructofuranosidase n=1 Tax=Streptomyces himalayensis subsp. aureolus TaxID=2758039 RepID=A0A7W2HEJ8_9ACTN|nr:glycoside hydrolase family 32 protein [Streptomyces himalayensis]MBA4860866.1 glycoside hydrolase family 32 protein [Streptomyces himalayensis subsp. aureolus]
MPAWLHYAPAKGWMNDPNGLVHWQGRHHLFYQYNPDGTEFTNQHWGHASSPDLLTWTEHEVALFPGPAQTAPYDATACFSGCAFEHDGGVSILYTGVLGDAQLPCLARAADDGLSGFVKDPANPLLPAPPAADITEFRDHSVWHEGGRWRQLVAGARREHGGSVFALSSADLRAWDYDGVLVDRAASKVPGAVWECPDYFAMEGARALLVSVIHEDGEEGPAVWWMTGTATDAGFEVRETGVADVGDRFYAPQSYWASDGRRIQFGWIRTHQDPAGLGRPATGFMTLPRELSVRHGRLHCEPAAELSLLRLTSTPVPVAGASGLEEGRTAGELVLDASAAEGMGTVALRAPDGAEMTVDLAAFAGLDGPLRLFWDAGIVEVFRGGVVGTWSDLRVTEVAELRLDGDAAAAGGLAEVWELARPERLAGPAAWPDAG